MSNSIQTGLMLALLVLTWPNILIAQADMVDPEPVIQVAEDEPNDARIESRIQNIFSKIDGLDAVLVEVEAGVVTLSGDASNERFANDAMDIATRTAGVVTVKDQINRTLGISDNVTPILTDFQASVRSMIRALPLTLVAFGVVIIFVLLGGAIARWNRLWQRIAPNPFLAELLSHAVRILIIALGVVLALNLIGASKFIATILGGAGVLGIAISFAVRDTLENYISSIMLSLRQPFRAHDHVTINEHEGYVVRLTSRATILMTLDGNHLRIPNSIVFKGIILNYSTNPERRFDFQLGVDGEDDPLIAMQVGLDAIKQHDFILDDPSAGAMIDFVGDSSIVIKFMAWVNQSDTNFSKARSVAIKAAKTALEDQGFTLPEPIYRLRFDGRVPPVLAELVSADASATKSQKNVKQGDAKSAQAPISKPLDVGEQVDVSADRQIQEKVSEERAKEAKNDLLDKALPTE
ncbi:mechanosensitive ion channel family protein [Arenicella xantha]|uniref:Small-conductance mechanosensitive channel n=1 Tax=Arenicella xantha TaxID=644221 RepID=A0A395JJM1_9GAMM|nr:mechanosensitive ion channel family protein [Arenicella xantha]RBP50709.1 small-conductance mechanosensitive channel [Arenicella xantha]